MNPTSMITVLASSAMLPSSHYSTALSALSSSSLDRISRITRSHDVDACPNGLTGPDCSIPYETCPDGVRRCLNNSKCTRNNRISKITGTYTYSCDCSFANDISPYAGHECEHSATMLCIDVIRGSHFCTNGGICGDYIYKAQVHTGCRCPMEYAGAHCQYLKFELDEHDHIIGRGQVLVGTEEENLWGFVGVEKKEKGVEGGIIAAFSLISLIILTLAVTFAAMRRRKIRFTYLDGRDVCNQGDIDLHLRPQNGEQQVANERILYYG